MQITLPAFAGACGLRPADVEIMEGEVRADGRALQFVERDADSDATGVASLSSPDRHVFSRGGRRSLFAAPPRASARRLMLASGALEAVCAAAWEGHQADTIYAAPPGCWTILSEEALLALVQEHRVVVVGLAFKPGHPGDALAAEAAEIVRSTFDAAVAVYRCPPRESWLSELRIRRLWGTA